MRLPVLLLIGLVAAGCGRSANSLPTPTVPAQSSVEAEVQATLARAADAYSKGQREAVEANYYPSEDITMVIYAPGAPGPDGEKHRVIRGISAIHQFYGEAPMFKPDFNRPKLSYESVSVSSLGPDLVNVVAIIGMDGGDPRVPRHAVSSMIMYRNQGRWQIVHDHTQ
jgi:hypothetical protein